MKIYNKEKEKFILAQVLKAMHTSLEYHITHEIERALIFTSIEKSVRERFKERVKFQAPIHSQLRHKFYLLLRNMAEGYDENR